MAQMKSLAVRQTDTEPPRWVDRTMRVVIFGGGALVLALLIWAHLGLGALVRPPAPTALQQMAQAGPYHVTFHTPSQMSARKVNIATFTLRDATGATLTDAQVRLSFTMVDMQMYSPDVTATLQSDGSYTAHPLFSMAGTWRMTAHIAVAGQPDQSVTFTVSVQWT